MQDAPPENPDARAINIEEARRCQPPAVVALGEEPEARAGKFYEAFGKRSGSTLRGKHIGGRRLGRFEELGEETAAG
jgi:hypothetical protein